MGTSNYFAHLGLLYVYFPHNIWLQHCPMYLAATLPNVFTPHCSMQIITLPNVFLHCPMLLLEIKTSVPLLFILFVRVKALGSGKKHWAVLEKCIGQCWAVHWAVLDNILCNGGRRRGSHTPSLSCKMENAAL